MREFVFTFYGYFVYFYSLALIAGYTFLVWSAYRGLEKFKSQLTAPLLRKIINRSPYTPGVTIIAPAYNEGRTIVENVRSLLALNYPKLELVVVNDGSKDDTLEKLIKNYELVEVPFDYEERIKTQMPYKRCFKSTNDKYKILTVIDKENAGKKADALNAGINASQYPYIVCTDADCIIDHNALYHCMNAVMLQNNVIAVSGNMSMANGCKIKDGEVIKAAPSFNPLVLFQTHEYLRSFLVGKMGWSNINTIPCVSGAFGLFEKKTVIESGGYRYDSMGEDMELVWRMIGICTSNNRDYHIVQIPQVCCWTEAPSNLKLLYRQRTRWARGFIQTLSISDHMFFRKKYGRLGVITQPYQIIFEFLAPIIEFIGIITFIWLALTDSVNWIACWVIMACIIIFGITVGVFTIFYDIKYTRTFTRKRSYFWLIVAALLEPLFYHPFITVFSLIGYWDHIVNVTAEWGEMTRKGFNKKKEEDTATESVATATA